MGPPEHEMLIFTIFSKIANFTSEIERFGQEYTGYFLGNTSNLLLDMSRNIGQPVEFYFRGGAWDPPLATKLHDYFTDGQNYILSTPIIIIHCAVI